MSSCKLPLICKTTPETGLANLKQRLAGLRDNSRVVSGGLAAIKVGTVALGATVGIISAVGAAALALTHNYAQQADQLSKLSARTGLLLSEDLSVLRHAADQGDVSFSELEVGLRRYNDGLDRARTDGGKFRENLLRVGIAADLVEKGLEGGYDGIVAFAEGISRIEDPVSRAAAAAEVFGQRAGPKLLPILQGGAAGLKEMKDEAEALGIVLDQTSADQAAEYNDAMDELRKIISSLGITVGRALVPVLTVLARRVIPFVARAIRVFSPH